MSEANKIDYTGAINAARKGDEDAYEFLFNQSIRKCRAICMKYFDPATPEGRRKTDEAVREVYVRMYDRIKTLSDPGDFPVLGRALTREVCLKKRKLESVQLETEAYIGVADARPAAAQPLVTADECREEVFGDVMLDSETIGTLVLAVLHEMTPAQRLAIVRWNENDPEAMRDESVLREAFICAEKTVMELEPSAGVRAKDYAKSRLAFFNWLLDLYNRFYEASTTDWNGAAEPAYSLAGPGDVPAEAEDTVSFGSIWSEIRQQFYITNTIQLPKGVTALGDGGEESLPGDVLRGYLEEEAEDSEAVPETPVKKPAAKRGFLSTWWGRLLVGLLLIVLVLGAVIVTAGQHTSHAMTPLFMQCADFAFEQACGFNIS
jgi:DNA-directed RNA polymerase specialized sigma24 family protein